MSSFCGLYSEIVYPRNLLAEQQDAVNDADKKINLVVKELDMFLLKEKIFDNNYRIIFSISKFLMFHGISIMVSLVMKNDIFCTISDELVFQREQYCVICEYWTGVEELEKNMEYFKKKFLEAVKEASSFKEGLKKVKGKD